MWDLFQKFLIAHPVLTMIVGAAVMYVLRLLRWNYFKNGLRAGMYHWMRKSKAPEHDPASFTKK